MATWGSILGAGEALMCAVRSVQSSASLGGGVLRLLLLGTLGSVCPPIYAPDLGASGLCVDNSLLAPTRSRRQDQHGEDGAEADRTTHAGPGQRPPETQHTPRPEPQQHRAAAAGELCDPGRVPVPAQGGRGPAGHFSWPRP